MYFSTLPSIALAGLSTLTTIGFGVTSANAVANSNHIQHGAVVPPLSAAPEVVQHKSKHTAYVPKNNHHFHMSFAGYDSRLRKRASYYITNSGFVTTDQRQASVFFLRNGQLFSGNTLLSANPTDQYISFAAQTPVGSITTTWTGNGGLLWRNSSFTYGAGTAQYCQGSDSRVYIIFQSTPPACNPVVASPVPTPGSSTSSTAAPVVASTTPVQVPSSTPLSVTSAASSTSPPPSTSLISSTSSVAPVLPTVPSVASIPTAPISNSVTVSAPSVPVASISVPSVTVPTTPVPSVSAPSISVPSVSASSISVPSILVPSVSVSSISVPSVPVPSVSMPTVSVPSVSAPSVSVPSVSVPSVSVPSVSVPSVSAPSASVPSVTVPSLTVPTASVPNLSLPTASVPSVSVPSVSLPSISVPTVSAPSVSVPSVSIPSIPVPSVSVPTASIAPISAPSVSAPTVPLPTLPIPSASVPIPSLLSVSSASTTSSAAAVTSSSPSGLCNNATGFFYSVGSDNYGVSCNGYYVAPNSQNILASVSTLEQCTTYCSQYRLNGTLTCIATNWNIANSTCQLLTTMTGNLTTTPSTPSVSTFLIFQNGNTSNPTCPQDSGKTYLSTTYNEIYSIRCYQEYGVGQILYITNTSTYDQCASVCARYHLKGFSCPSVGYNPTTGGCFAKTSGLYSNGFNQIYFSAFLGVGNGTSPNVTSLCPSTTSNTTSYTSGNDNYGVSCKSHFAIGSGPQLELDFTPHMSICSDYCTQFRLNGSFACVATNYNFATQACFLMSSVNGNLTDTAPFFSTFLLSTPGNATTGACPGDAGKTYTSSTGTRYGIRCAQDYFTNQAYRTTIGANDLDCAEQCSAQARNGTACRGATYSGLACSFLAAPAFSGGSNVTSAVIAL